MLDSSTKRPNCQNFTNVAEHTRSFTEGEVRGDDDRGALIEPANEVEQELAAPAPIRLISYQETR
jgi:hypothetical protein